MKASEPTSHMGHYDVETETGALAESMQALDRSVMVALSELERLRSIRDELVAALKLALVPAQTFGEAEARREIVRAAIRRAEGQE